jgi:hypothetical protein
MVGVVARWLRGLAWWCAVLSAALLAGLALLAAQQPDAAQRGLVEALNELALSGCSEAQRRAKFDTGSDPASADWAPALRGEWRAVRDELLAWEKRFGGESVPHFSAVDPVQRQVEPHGQWQTLWLQVFGRETLVARHFPRTMELLRATPATSAMFSSLPHGRGLEVHRGELKFLLRYHLALLVDPPAPGKSEEEEPLTLNVAPRLFYRDDEDIMAERYSWTEGEDLLFDDTFIHSVTNARSGRGRRVVLFLDVPRADCGPALGFFFGTLLRHVLRFVPRVSNIARGADMYMAHAEHRIADAPTPSAEQPVSTDFEQRHEL